MIYEFDSIDAYAEACEDNPDLRGVSPGGARSALGITRQGVFSAVKRGSLDMVRISVKGGSPCLIIPESSIVEYSSQRSGRKGPIPGFRQRVKMDVDKYVHNLWPSDRS